MHINTPKIPNRLNPTTVMVVLLLGLWLLLGCDNSTYPPPVDSNGLYHIYNYHFDLPRDLYYKTPTKMGSKGLQQFNLFNLYASIKRFLDSA